MSNNSPDHTLNLTKDEAQFLLKNCNVNITMMLGGLQSLTSRDSMMQLVLYIEQFKAIREKLVADGVKEID